MADREQSDAELDPVRLSIELRDGRGLVLIRVRPEETDARLAVESALGAALPLEPNTFAAAADERTYWLGPDEWVVDLSLAAVAPRIAALRAATTGLFAAVVDLSAGRVCLRIAGTAAIDLLRKGCPLDLHSRVFAAGACARTVLGRIGVLLACIETGCEYHIVVDRSFADDLRRWLADAALGLADASTAGDHRLQPPATPTVHPSGEPT